MSVPASEVDAIVTVRVPGAEGGEERVRFDQLGRFGDVEALDRVIEILGEVRETLSEARGGVPTPAEEVAAMLTSRPLPRRHPPLGVVR